MAKNKLKKQLKKQAVRAAVVKRQEERLNRISLELATSVATAQEKQFLYNTLAYKDDHETY